MTTVNLVNPFWEAPAVSAGPHEYWRLRPAGAEDEYMEITLIEMAATPGGANQCTGGTAVTSDWTNPSQAFAGALDWAERFNTIGIDTTWIGYQFTAPVSVREIRLTASPTRPDRCPRVAFVDSSDDGVTWTPRGWIFDAAVYPAGSATKTFEVLPLATSQATARFWGVDVYGNGGGWTTIAELEFMTSAGGASLCVGGVAWGSRFRIGNPTDYGFDGTNTTAWQAGTGIVEGRLQYAFPSAPNPTHMALQARSAFLTDTPTDWRIQYTLDGITWTTVRDVSGETGWTASERRVFAF